MISIICFEEGKQGLVSVIDLFQRKEPLIHILHSQMKTLVFDLLSKLFSATYLSAIKVNGTLRLNTVLEMEIPKQKKELKSQLEVGSRTKSLLNELNQLEKKNFLRCLDWVPDC